MTRDVLLAYLSKLRPEARAIFLAAEQLVNETEDTLSEEFQLAAGVVEMFYMRAKEANHD